MTATISIPIRDLFAILNTSLIRYPQQNFVPLYMLTDGHFKLFYFTSLQFGSFEMWDLAPYVELKRQFFPEKKKSQISTDWGLQAQNRIVESLACYSC